MSEKPQQKFGRNIPTDWVAPVVDARRTTDDVAIEEGKYFTDFHLHDDLLRGIYENGYNRPSPIQWDAIPEILFGKHILARAKNGTGKTASYLIPILESINYSEVHPQALILVPNRELALQTSTNMQKLGKYMNVKVQCLVGGTQTHEDIIRLKQGVHAIVATPGRLLDIATRMPTLLDKCQYFVLDEADKLLSDDFIDTINEIMKYIPTNSQKILFSATYPKHSLSFIDEHMKENLSKINLMDELTLKGITQYYIFLEEKDKVRITVMLLNKLKINQCIIFCNSVKRVEALAKYITDQSVSCYFIHSKMEQSERNNVYQKFTTGSAKHLVASDVFTRGIDVQTVNVVLNFDLPASSETYLHRIGRSGRFGHFGLAINLITDADRENFYRIENILDTEITAFPQNEEIDTNLYNN